MSNKTHSSTDPLHIRESGDGERSVVLHPEDDDLFIRTGRQVIEACRLGISLELWRHELRSMLDRVAAWAAERADRVSACFVSPRHTKIVLFVTPRAEQFDFDLADELVDLQLELLRNFQVGQVEVLQIPLKQIDRFTSEEESRKVYASD